MASSRQHSSQVTDFRNHHCREAKLQNAAVLGLVGYSGMLQVQILGLFSLFPARRNAA